jgi:glycosyltransferase involved in cell wall biosynthesis
MLSIIIPTLNEENYLPFLLESIKKQDFLDYEIIVADAGSKDKTIELAKEHGVKVIPGGLPAKGRNEGAKVSKGDLLLFLDADIILSPDFFTKTLEEFEKRKLDVASFCLDSQSKRKRERFLFNFFYNWPIIIFEKVLSHGSQAILVKREIFKEVNGFDENIKFAEDHNLVRKIKKIGRFGIIKSIKILSSIRRFEKDGWLSTYFRYIMAELYMIFFGDIKEDLFKYEFGHYSILEGYKKIKSKFTPLNPAKREFRLREII